MTTTTNPTTAQEVERSYDVALAGDLIIKGVRLRYTPGEEPTDRLGEEARKHAARRAAVLAKRRGDTRRFDLDDAGVVPTRERLVPARQVTDRDLNRLADKFQPNHTKAPAPKANRKAKHGRNGYTT
jgi:hypothetical protein